MSNEYLTYGGTPTTRSNLSSQAIRGVFQNIVDGFGKFPTMAGNGGKLTKINAAGTEHEASTISEDADGQVAIGGTPTGTAKASITAESTSAGLAISQVDETGAVPVIQTYNTTASGAAQFGVYHQAANIFCGNARSGAVVFFTNGTERMRIDALGNVISGLEVSVPALSANRTMAMNLTSDTNLRISVRGADGVTRTTNLTLA